MSALDSIRLGVMPPLTGLAEIYGEEISMAARIACLEVNESGGILGRPLELIIEDDGSLPDSAVSAAKKLVEERRCSAIIGNLLSNSRISVAYRVAEPSRIPYLNFSFYEGSISSRYFFHFAALPNQQIDRMIPYMQKLCGPRMFFAGNNYEWPRGSIDAAKKILEMSGGTVAGEEYCPIGITPCDIERLLDRVSGSGADVFVPYFAGTDQVRLLTAFTARGLKKRMAVVMGHYDEAMASHLSPQVRDGFYSSNTYFITVDTPENRRYLERLKTMPGITGIWPQGNGILTNFGEGTYLCVKAFALAANKAGNTEPEALINALESISLTGPQGTVSMDPKTHHARVNTYLSQCQADGAFKIIEQFGAIDPVLPERYRHLKMGPKIQLDEDIRIQSRMLEQMTEAVFLIDAQDGTIVYTNPGSERMFGYGTGELLGKNVSTLNAPSDKTPEGIAEDINSILYRKGVWRGEILNIKKDGSTFCSSASISTFTHARFGEVWMAVYMDITERKRAEERIRESEKRFRIMTDNSPLAIYMSTGIKQKAEYINPTFIRLFGYTLDEVPSASEWWPLAYPDEGYRKQVSEEWNRRVEKAIRTNSEIKPMEVVVTCKDGSKKNILWGNVSTGGQNWAFGLDLTDRRKAEAELRASSLYTRSLIEASLDPLVTISPDGKITDVNSATESVTGFSRQELIGSDFSSYFTEPDKAKEGYLRVFEIGFVRDYSLEIRHRDGHLTPVLYNAGVYKDEEGKVIGVFAAARDITELKRAEENLRIFNNELEQRVAERTAQLGAANKELEAFSYSVSHDLRAPLRAISGFSQIVAEDYRDRLDEEGKKALGLIIINVHKMGQLIEDLLAFSRMGRKEMMQSEIDMAALVREVVEELGQIAPERSMRFGIKDIPASYGDAAMLRQVFINLISNAIKFTRPKEVAEIEVGSMIGEKETVYYVKDNGVGFDMNYANKLFGVFQRLHSSAEFEGTGVGLALVNRIIQKHGGRVWAEGKVNEGATFYFSLPGRRGA